MSDPHDSAAADTTQTSLSDEIGRSVSAIWQRHAGPRPVAVHTVFAGDSVRCTIELPPSTDADPPAEAEDSDEPDCYDRSEIVRSPQSTRYRNEATASVRRLTGRRVRGYVAKREPVKSSASDTFILEPVQTYF